MILQAPYPPVKLLHCEHLPRGSAGGTSVLLRYLLKLETWSLSHLRK